VDSPQMLAFERLDKASRVVRDLTAKLRDDRHFAASNLVAICDLERELAVDFRRRGKYSDSRALLMDSLELLEGRRNTAADPEIDLAYAHTLLTLGQCDSELRQFDATLAWAERAQEALKSWAEDPRHLEAIVMTDKVRRVIAEQLGRCGLKEQRRQLLETHIRMLEHLSGSRGGDPAIGLLAAMVRADLAADGSAIAILRCAIQRFPADQRLPAEFEARVGDWIASDVNPYPSVPNGTGDPKGRLDPDAHADLVIRAIESRCEALSVDRSLLPAVARQVAGIAAIRGSEQRKVRPLDDARRTAACLSAFAKRLVLRNRDEPAFHLVLSAAFVQESKNAWQVEDFVAIKEALQQALGEARTALRLDPRNLDTRMTIANLQDRLVRLPSEPPLTR
jgi:tetratricopeptide (TPR) repeat protein